MKKFIFKTFYLALLVKLLLSVLVTGSNGFIPDVSQEGILRPFRSYSDITLFHYYVPPEVTRVTWEFAAFMDNSACPAKQVHVYVQHGSYPLINATTSNFPPNTYIGRTSWHHFTTKSSFEPRNPTIFPVYNPLPGNWYAAAYVPNWDMQVKQEGISRKCHYSLGSVTIWSQIKNVSIIPTGSKKEVFSAGASSFYKFYIPSQTWHFSLNISNCNFRIPSMKEKGGNLTQNCMLYVAINAKALPSSNQKGAVTNVTEGSGHSFTVTEPFTDCYYYLLVISEARISFNAEIITKECRYEVPQRNNFKKVDHTKELFKSATFYSGKVSGRTDWPINISYSNQSVGHSEEIVLPRGAAAVCPTVFHLSRIKHSEDFYVTFLLQGDGWSTNWIALSDLYATYAQLEILPFMDIGGTLSVSISLDDQLLNTTKQLIVVTACIKQGAIPQVINSSIMCSFKLKMIVTSNNTSTIGATKLIPFPEPDIWFIAFQLNCFINGSTVPCGLKDILVKFNIQVHRCVFPFEACGSYGICQETHKGLHYFTSCFCLGGYSGWGCTDGQNALLHSTLLLNTLLLTLSNVFFLPAILLALRQYMISEALVYLATMIFSTFYHACDEDFYSYCVTKYEVLQFCDFFFSIFSFWVTLIATANIPAHLVSAFHIVGVIIIAIGVEYNRTGLLVFVIPSALGLSVPLYYWCIRCYKQSRILFQLSSFLRILPGIILAAIGLIMFAFVETEANYQYVHSTWHIVIALSLLFLLPRVTVEADDYPQANEAELYDINDCSHISPVFVITSDVDNLINS
ncbi:post-GPI attachment to proteins factor 6 [Hetaerina americana]|uniref:post-GPI attachment to proteins factor 6 n=1 Tax=Hetaerina americana TaxID=62018 RepID=UPI003A7F584C